MLRYLSFVTALSLLVLLNSALAAEANLSPDRLRCEYLTNPLGVDVPQPRLSWIVTATESNQAQTAYRILVASSTANLSADKGDLWDSGKVMSDETIGTPYAGAPLKSHQACYWKVQVWDKAGQPSAWSAPAQWSVGLLVAKDWKAEWIGYDAARVNQQPEAPLTGAKWICHPDDKNLNGAKGHRLFSGRIKLPDNVESAELFAVGDDKIWVVLNGHTLTSAQVGWKDAKSFNVAPHVKAGENDLRVQVENDTAGPTGLLVKLLIKTKDGKSLTFSTDDTWRAGAPSPNWHKSEIDTAKWPAAHILGEYGMQPWGKSQKAGVALPPAVYLRKEFTLTKPVSRAMLYTTALGICDAHLNGARISDDYFTPGWTDYTKRVYYRAYDVTKSLQAGANVLGGVLADGWYSGYVGYGRMRNHYGKQPRYAAQLHVEFADGSSQEITTDNSWQAAVGPIVEADFLMGETYDAGREIAGWNQPGAAKFTGQAVVTGAELKPVLQWHPGPAVRPFQELQAKSITEPKPGVFVLNFAQNFAGVPVLKVRGEAGQKITLRFAERLNPDGTIYTTNLREARCVDTYTCRGGEVETWSPRFTFHGFQYLEITGVKSKPAPDTVTALALSSETPVAGKFTCSDPMLNQLHSNIYWTQRANFIDIPTDCPQRDERLGWTGDAQVYIRTATLNTDVQAFFTKWLVDLNDGQRRDGQFPMVAPVKVAGDDGGPAWADAGVICPWTVYEVYGDKQALAKSYPHMVKFVEFCQKRSTPELLPPSKFHCFGDWLSIKANTPTDVIYTAYFAKSTQLTAQAAEVLGKTEDAKKYQELYAKIKAAFVKAYVAADGKIKGDTQACYVLAIAFDLLNPEQQKQAAARLVADIEAKGHLSTGFIGTKDLMLALSKIGRNDVAYKLLHNESFPSWGFSIKHGATSIWERWDGWTPEKGFQDPGMNSFAHYSFGAVYQWMVENIGGIRSVGITYKKLEITVPTAEPASKSERLTSANVRYDSIRGPIETKWSRTAKGLEFEVTVPANTQATVRVPSQGKVPPKLDGKPLDVRNLKPVDGVYSLEVGSGKHVLEVAK